MNELQSKNRLARAIRHAEQDRLIAGTYHQMNGKPKGCSVGCDAFDIHIESGKEPADFNDSGCHLAVAENDGTPEWLERLRDKVFEGLPESKRSWWHVELAKALDELPKPITDAQFKQFFHQICIGILKNVLRHKGTWQGEYRDKVIDSIQKTIEYHQDPSEAKRSAAWSAAWSAAESAAESEAESAAESARSAARSAAWSAARSAAAAAAWSAAASARSAAAS